MVSLDFIVCNFVVIAGELGLINKGIHSRTIVSTVPSEVSRCLPVLLLLHSAYHIHYNMFFTQIAMLTRETLENIEREDTVR